MNTGAELDIENRRLAIERLLYSVELGIYDRDDVWLSLLLGLDMSRLGYTF